MTLVYGLRVRGGPVRYIGQTVKSLTARLSGHRYWAFRRRSSLPVHAWMRKHGDDIEIFLICEGEHNVAEIEAIAQARRDGADLLNCTDGGLGLVGWKMSDETRRNISLGRRGISNPREAIVKASRARRALTDDQVEEAKSLRPMSYAKIGAQLGVSASTVQSAINSLRPCYRVCTSEKSLGTHANAEGADHPFPSDECQQKEMNMAELDEKTQRIVDRAVKAERTRLRKAINEQIAGANDDAKTIEDKGTKRAVLDAVKALKEGVKDAMAD